MDSRILPEMFVNAYEALSVASLDDGSGAGNHPLSGRGAELGRAEGKPTGQWPVKSNEITSIGQRTGPELKTVGKTSRFLKDERAFRLKTKMDKRLRAMAREMMAFLEAMEGQGGRGSEEKARKAMAATASRLCTGKCRKIGDGEWLYCARCGGPMRDLSEDEA